MKTYTQQIELLLIFAYYKQAMESQIHLSLDFIDIQLFDPKEASEGQWQEYHEYRAKRHQESSPDDDMYPNQMVETAMKQEELESLTRRFWIYHTLEKKLIGTITLSYLLPESDSYKGNEELLQAGITILNDYHRKGIGTFCLRFVLNYAKDTNKSKILTNTDNEDGKAFLKRLNAPMSLAGAENRLDLTQLDWQMINQWIQEGEERNPHTSLNFVTSIPEDIIEQYAKVYSAVNMQQPLGEIEVGELVVSPKMLRKKENDLKQLGATWLTAYTQEENGDISGLTELIHLPSRPSYIMQDLTGVVDKYRGRGLGKWLKAANLLKAKEMISDIMIVITGNADANAPMLSINKRMGFYKYKENMLSQIPLSLIEEYLNNKTGI